MVAIESCTLHRGTPKVSTPRGAYPDVVIGDHVRHLLAVAILLISEDDLVLVVEQHVARVLLIEHVAGLPGIPRLHQHPLKHLHATGFHAHYTLRPLPMPACGASGDGGAADLGGEVEGSLLALVQLVAPQRKKVPPGHARCLWVCSDHIHIRPARGKATAPHTSHSLLWRHCRFASLAWRKTQLPAVTSVVIAGYPLYVIVMGQLFYKLEVKLITAISLTMRERWQFHVPQHLDEKCC
jgi:hypothetical protein